MNQEEAVKRLGACFAQEYDIAKIQEYYQKWAVDYDNDMLALNFVACQSGSSKLAKYIQSPSTTPVADFGCGSGSCAQHLKHYGFTEIDGIDISAEMLAKAKETKLYRNIFKVDMSKTMDLNGNKYDAALSTGTYVNGHVKPESIFNVLDCMNVGGIFVFTAREDYRAGLNLDDFVKKMASDGFVEILQAEYDQPYHDLTNATYYTLKKL